MTSFLQNLRKPSALSGRAAFLAIALLTLAVSACGGGSTTPPQGAAPNLLATAPADGASGAPLNAKISATFDLAMDSLSTTTFTLKQGTTAVAGTVTTSADGTSATFAPSSSLSAGTVYTATITAGAKSAGGVALAADSSWSFTTGTTPDNSAPVVSGTNPADGASGVAVNAKLSATFSKEMDPVSITSASFTVKQAGVAVPGSVTYGPGATATFTSSAQLAASLPFVASLGADVKDLSGNALAAAFTWGFTTGTTVATVQAPTVISSFPVDAAVGVPLNAKLAVTFDMAMTPLSATTFTLKQGTTAVAGAVATSLDGKSATFKPTSSLAASSVYTATITGGAKSAAGVPFAADTSFSFTTGASADATPPAVSATNPADGATGVLVNAKISATFSKPMDPLTITSATLTVKQGNSQVAGTVVYGPGTSATFTAFNQLASNTLFTATVSTGVKDVAGNSIAAAFSWSFTTGTAVAKGPAPVGLGTAGNFAILAKTSISTVPTSAVTGDIGISPAAASYITAFSLVADSTNVFATSPQIVGKAYAANYAVPTPSNLTTAVSNMETAYTDAASRPTPDFLELGTGAIGGKTLVPGLYKWTTTVTVLDDVVISGGANDVWIFQTTKDLTMAGAKHITLAGGAQAKNVFWQVTGKVTLGTGAHFEGILLCKTEVTLQTGTTMNGRILAQTQVALQQATVTQPAH